MIELLTIGYEKMTREDFFELVERRRVSMLIDVRQEAVSRRPGFGKTALKEALANRGIKYAHVAELGCPREVSAEDSENEGWADHVRRCKIYLSMQEGALELVARWIREERCCLMCYESDHNLCYRGLIAEQMVEWAGEGVRIHHLTAAEFSSRR